MLSIINHNLPLFLQLPGVRIMDLKRYEYLYGVYRGFELGKTLKYENLYSCGYIEQELSHLLNLSTALYDTTIIKYEFCSVNRDKK